VWKVFDPKPINRLKFMPDPPPDSVDRQEIEAAAFEARELQLLAEAEELEAWERCGGVGVV
jgi:hypothetical protein